MFFAFSTLSDQDIEYMQKRTADMIRLFLKTKVSIFIVILSMWSVELVAQVHLIGVKRTPVGLQPKDNRKFKCIDFMTVGKAAANIYKSSRNLERDIVDMIVTSLNDDCKYYRHNRRYFRWDHLRSILVLDKQHTLAYFKYALGSYYVKDEVEALFDTLNRETIYGENLILDGMN